MEICISPFYVALVVRRCVLLDPVSDACAYVVIELARARVLSFSLSLLLKVAPQDRPTKRTLEADQNIT